MYAPAFASDLRKASSWRFYFYEALRTFYEDIFKIHVSKFHWFKYFVTLQLSADGHKYTSSADSENAVAKTRHGDECLVTAPACVVAWIQWHGRVTRFTDEAEFHATNAIFRIRPKRTPLPLGRSVFVVIRRLCRGLMTRVHVYNNNNVIILYTVSSTRFRRPNVTMPVQNLLSSR